MEPAPSSLLKNASCLRAWSLVRSLRRASCVESQDSTPFSLLDIEPDPEPSATEPFFNMLLGPLALATLYGRSRVLMPIAPGEVSPMCRVAHILCAGSRIRRRMAPPPRVERGGEGRVLVCCLTVP